MFSLVSCFGFSQNLVQNSSFESEGIWKSKGDAMERHHQNILGVVPVDGVYYAELASDNGYQLYQEIEIEKGAYYEVSFYAQARPNVSPQESYFTFEVDDILSTECRPQLQSWQLYQFTFTPQSNKAVLKFEDSYFGKSGIGAMIDEVHVQKLERNFVQIFDGKSLNGWKQYGKTEDLAKNLWQVHDGTIVCNSMEQKDHGGVFLFFEEELDNFELKLKIQAFKSSPGNSGIQIRSRYDETGDIDGPQVDIHPPNPFRTGLLYDETDHYNRWLYPSMPNYKITPEIADNQAPFYYKEDGKWNDLHIICSGTDIKTYLNGVLVTDFKGRGILNDKIHEQLGVGMKGKVALQVHTGHEIKIAFKDILLKKL